MKCPLFGPKTKKTRKDFMIYNMVHHDLHRSPSTVTMAKLNSVLFICLLNDAVSSSDYIALNGRIRVNDGMKGMQKEVIMA
jgi:hypothetical protein